MSLETELKQGIAAWADELQARHPADVEGALGSVRLASGRRQKVQMVAIGLTALLGLLAALSLKDIERFISMERDVPPAERNIKDSREVEPDGDQGQEAPIGSEEASAGSGRAPLFGAIDIAGGGQDTRLPDPRPVAGEQGDAGRSGRTSRPRVEEAPYQTTSDTVADATGCWAARVACDVKFEAEPDERWISVAILDSNSRAMRGRIYIDRNGDGEVDDDGIEFCSETASPIRIPSGGPVHVRVIGPGCAGGMGGASQGKVRVTFYSSRPT